MIKIIKPGRREVDIRRPDGSTETVDVSDRFPFLDDGIVTIIRSATLRGGRGELIGWRNIDATYHDDHIYNCDRCDNQLDDRTAHAELNRINGVLVRTLYCHTCAAMINAMRD